MPVCVCGAAARAQLKGEVGTPMWMAPEVLMNESFTFKADVYSFGVIVWELLTGKVPWKGTHSTQQISPVPSAQPRSMDQSATMDPFQCPSNWLGTDWGWAAGRVSRHAAGADHLRCGV